MFGRNPMVESKPKEGTKGVCKTFRNYTVNLNAFSDTVPNTIQRMKINRVGVYYYFIIEWIIIAN